MKERQRWKSEEDAILRAYVRQYGPREWNLVSQRMNVPFHRDAKSCLERWKNYLKPGIKKGSLSEEEQRLVIRLQAKHGNKWKKIAAEVPGRTAKRLGKWWEVFKEKQQRELQENNRTVIEPLEEGKYDQLLENFAEKLVKERTSIPFLMAAPLLPPWLSNPSNSSGIRPPSPSVTLSLSSANAHADPSPWMHPERTDNNVVLSSSENGMVSRGLADNIAVFAASQNGMCPRGLSADGLLVAEISECCRELEEGHQAWRAHKKETSWRLKRVELQLESEKAKKRREKIEEIESKVRALKEEQEVTLERVDAEYKEQILGFRKDAEVKEQKLIDQWVAKHMRLAKFLEQMGGGYKQ